MKSLLSKAIQEVLVTGDGAFKISFDTDLSQYPIIEFFSGEYVDYKLNRGRVEEIVFYSRYGDEKKTYTLAETYGKGYVNYELRNASGKVVAMDKVKELESLVNVTYKGADFILAVPFKVYDSPKWDGRGCSIFDSKTDAFDALDETVSQWQDAIRLGRIKRYIPESMICLLYTSNKKQSDYIIRSQVAWLNVLEGGKRSSKNITNLIAWAMSLETHPDKLHLAAGYTQGAAKMNIIDSNGFGLKWIFAGRCREGLYQNIDALYINTPTGQKIVLVAGGGKINDLARIDVYKRQVYGGEIDYDFKGTQAIYIRNEMLERWKARGMQDD